MCSDHSDVEVKIEPVFYRAIQTKRVMCEADRKQLKSK